MPISSKDSSKKCRKCAETVLPEAKKCKHCGTDLRNWFVRHKILTGLLVFVVILIAASGGEESDTYQASSGQDTVAQEAKSYQEVFTFSGNGAKKSEPFTIKGSRFKIKYTCNGDLCQAFLHSTSNEFDLNLIMNTTGSVSDETIIYGSGEYYIEANTLGTYSMVVEDYR